MAHPLDGASLRLERANVHLAEADRLIDGFAHACEQYIVTDNQGHISRLKGWPDIPPMLPVVVSDVIHNLRAALDYIVFELARSDSGEVQDGTQFIIEDCKVDPADRARGFDARSKRYLKGLSQEHIEATENLQRYKGVDWTKSLRDISNPDKHRTLTVLTSFGRSLGVTLHWKPTGKFGTNRLRVASPGRAMVDRYDIELNAENAIVIAPADPGKPALMPTLHLIEAEVGHTIEMFKPEFKI